MDFDRDLLKKKPDVGTKKPDTPKAAPGRDEDRPLLGNQAALRLLDRLPPPLVSRLGDGIAAVVYFGQNRFLLEGENFKAVEKLGEELRYRHEPILTVNGHASGEGTASYNMSLSEKRRQAVIATLSAKLAGKPKVGGKAFGEEQMAVAEDAKDPKEREQQRAANRRVEIFITPSLVVAPEKKPDLRPPVKMEPEESPEQRVARIIKEKPPEPPPKRSFSKMFWDKFDEKAEDILRKAKVPATLRPYIKDAARAAIEKGAEKALDEALGKAGLNDQEKRAVKEALKAAGEIKF